MNSNSGMKLTGDAEDADSIRLAANPPPPKTAPWHRHLLNLAIVGLISLFILAPGIDLLPLTDRDEALYVQASRQMLETGNWIDIRFQQEPRYKKPVGIYWLQGMSAMMFGDGAASPLWVYRLPSLIGALLTALFTYLIAARMAGTKAGLVAGILAASTVELAFEARIGKTDAMLCAAITAAQFGLLSTYLDPERKQVLWRNTLFWLAMGVGTLIKGPVAPMICGFTILGLTATERNLSLVRGLSPIRGVVAYMLVVLPWLAAIGWISNGAFFEQSVGHDMLGKIATAQESHGAPPGTYLIVSLATFWPLSIFASLALLWGWRNRQLPAIRFLFFWAVPAWLVFELIATKLPNYILPMMPALAILTGLALANAGLKTGSRWFRFTYLCLAIVGTILAVGLNAAFFAIEDRLNWTGIALGIVLIGVSLGAWRLLIQNRMESGLAAMVATAALAYCLAFYVILPQAKQIWLSDRIAEAALSTNSCANPERLSVGYEEPSVVFRLGTGMQRVGVQEAAQAYHKSSCVFAAVAVEQSAQFLNQLHSLGEQTLPKEVIEGRNLNGFQLRRMVIFVKG